nr:hypothetical protein [uncultured Cohaesibacter sp.]
MFVFDFLLEAIGYSTARVVLPIISFGYLSVEPVSSKEKVYNWLGFKSSNNSKYLCEATMAGWLGLVPWVVLMILIFATW